MRHNLLRAIAASALALASVSGPASAATLVLNGVSSDPTGSWQPTNNPADNGRAAVGCSDASDLTGKSEDAAWVCLVVRCESSGEVAIYADVTQISLEGRWTLGIDSQSFKVKGAARGKDRDNSSRLSGDIPAILAALKSGSVASIEGKELASGFDQISLTNSSAMINGVQKACS